MTWFIPSLIAGAILWLGLCWLAYRRFRRSVAWLAAPATTTALAATGIAALASVRLEGAWLLAPVWILNAVICLEHLRAARRAAVSPQVQGSARSHAPPRSMADKPVVVRTRI